MTSVGNACGTSNIYLAPPEWYIKSGPQLNLAKIRQAKQNASQKTPFSNQ
jgi:hypothetical protein